MTQITLSIPNNEVGFLQTLADKMGWKVEKSNDTLSNFLASCQGESNFSDEDIQKEVDEVRKDS